jgi:hypothetical protein
MRDPATQGRLISIWLSQDEPIGVKWNVTFGFRSNQA